MGERGGLEQAQCIVFFKLVHNVIKLLRIDYEVKINEEEKSSKQKNSHCI